MTTKRSRKMQTFLFMIMLFISGQVFAKTAVQAASEVDLEGRAAVPKLTFEECLEIGLENSRMLRVSALGVDIARAQLEQVLRWFFNSRYWSPLSSPARLRWRYRSYFLCFIFFNPHPGIRAKGFCGDSGAHDRDCS